MWCWVVGSERNDVNDGDAEGLGQMDVASESMGPSAASVTCVPLVSWERARATAHGIALAVGVTTRLRSKRIELSARVSMNGDEAVGIPPVVVLQGHVGQGAAVRAFASLRCELLLHFVRPAASA